MLSDVDRLSQQASRLLPFHAHAVKAVYAHPVRFVARTEHVPTDNFRAMDIASCAVVGVILDITCLPSKGNVDSTITEFTAITRC